MNFKTPTKTTILNVLSVFMLQGIAFITLPIFTRLLGTEQFGIFSVYNSWVSVFTNIIALNVGSTVGIARYHIDDYKKYRSATLLLGTFIAAAFITLGLIFVNFIAGWMGYGINIVVIMLFAAFGNFVTGMAQTCFIYEKKPQINFIFSVLMSLASVGLSLLLIYNGPESERYIGRIYGCALPHIVAAVILWFIVFLKRPTFINKEYTKFAIKLGLPTVFHLLSHTVLVQSDRIMMQKMGTAKSEIGIYSAFYSLTAILTTILTALNNSWCPFYYDDLKEEAFEKLDKKCKNYMELFTIVVCGFILVVREVAYVYAGEEYFSGINVFPILAVAVYCTFMYQFPVNFEFYHKKTVIVATGTVCCAILNITLNYFMIQKWGMYGAAIATAISYFALFICHFVIVCNFKTAKFHLKFTRFIPGFLAVTAASLSFYLLPDFWYIRWPIAIAIGTFEIIRMIKRKTIF